MKTTNIIIQTKGGVGKTTLSQQCLPCLTSGNVNIYEIDDNNRTDLKNSSLIIKNIKVKAADTTLDDIFYDDFMNPKNKNIVDVGGGNDSVKILELLKQQAVEEVQFYLPIKSGEDAFNLKKTIDMLPENANINIVCMGYMDIDKIEMEFMYVFGNDVYEIPNIKELYKDKNIEIKKIPFSNLFSIARGTYKKTVVELAKEVENVNPKDFREQLKNEKVDQQTYRKKYAQYRFARECLELVEQIQADLKD